MLPTASATLQRAWLTALLAFACYSLRSNERWVSQCLAEGIYGTATLREWSRQRARERAAIAALRTRLICLRRPQPRRALQSVRRLGA